MVQGVLPLFPLNVVLFPGSSLPLHIFEGRYKLLIGECLKKEGMEFGINLVTGEKLSFIGCTAVTGKVLKRYDDGKLDLVVHGARRYSLHSFDENSAPYVLGHVTFFREEADAVDMKLREETIGLYNRLVQTVHEHRVPTLAPNEGTHLVSFIMAQKIGMSLRERQELLEMHSENARLQRVMSYLIDVVPRLKHSQEIQRIANNDGYLTHS
jgi:Lon protease-like protein